MAVPSLTKSPKYRLLVRQAQIVLSIGQAHLRGLLETMWDCAHSTGNPEFNSIEELEAAADWMGSDGAFANLLLKMKWVDELEGGRLLIHDYWDHAPDYAKDKFMRDARRQVAGKTLKALRAEAGRKGAESRWQNNDLPSDENGKSMANQKHLPSDDGKRMAKTPLRREGTGFQTTHTPPLPPHDLPFLPSEPSDGMCVGVPSTSSSAGGDPPAPPENPGKDDTIDDPTEIARLFKRFLIAKKLDASAGKVGPEQVEYVRMMIADGRISVRSWYAAMYFLIWHVGKTDYGYAQKSLKAFDTEYVEGILERARKEGGDWQILFPEFKRRFGTKKRAQAG